MSRDLSNPAISPSFVSNIRISRSVLLLARNPETFTVSEVLARRLKDNKQHRNMGRKEDLIVVVAGIRCCSVLREFPLMDAEGRRVRLHKNI